MTRFALALLTFPAISFAVECNVASTTTDAVTSGALQASDCKISDFFPGFINTNSANIYSVNVTRRLVLTIKLESTKFDALLYVANSSRATIAVNDNINTTTTDSQIVVNLDPGAYYIAATARGAISTGDYKLTTQSSDIRDCPIRPLTIGDTINRAIAVTDCRVLDYTPLSSNIRVLHRYSITVAKRAVFTISLKSIAFDAWLILLDSTGATLASDDNSGGLTDSLLTVSLNPGSYVLEASARQPPYAGDYTLKATADDPRPCPITDLAGGQTISASYTSSGCRMLDIFTPSSDITYADQYRVKIDKRSVLTADQRSRDLDAYLELYSTGMNLIGSDDNGGGGTNASLLVSLQPGVYILIAEENGPDLGAYTLASIIEDPRSCTPVDIGVSDLKAATLARASCRYLDLVAPSTDTSINDVYKLDAPKLGVLKAAMSAGRFDAFLTLNDRDILTNAGTLSAEEAKEIAASEYKTYLTERRRLEAETPNSDFDKFVEQVKKLPPTEEQN